MTKYLFQKSGFILAMIASLLGCSKSAEEIGKAELSVSPDTLNFGSNLNSLPISVRNSGASTLSWEVTPTQTWISCDPDSGVNDDSVEVQVLRTQLIPGDHSGSVNITSNAGASVVEVILTEDPPPAPSCIYVSRTSESSISISWCSVSAAHDYRLYRGELLDTGYWTSTSLLTTTSFYYYTDAAVDQARYYRYQVSARKYGVEGNKTSLASGYRKGCRLEDISYYDPTDGIGFNYDLHAYGYKDQTRALAIYAVYESGGSYYYVPGTGFDYKAAYVFYKTPSYDTSLFNDNWAYIYNTTWDPNWRNNTYPQYIKMRVYRSATITSLSNAYYDQTGYWSMTWTTSASGQPVPIIGKRIPLAKAEEIDAQITGKIAPGFSPSPHSGKEGVTREENHHPIDRATGTDN